MTGYRSLIGERLAAIAGAVVLDLALGEPRADRHPVVWIGRLIAALEQMAKAQGSRQDQRRELITGTAVVGLTIGAAALPAIALERALPRRPRLFRLAAAALALKPAFATRALFDSVAAIEAPLLSGNIPAARTALRRIVSRDISQLDGPLIAAAAIESLMENLSDSVIAPLLAYALGGLPLAYTYRAANTLDAMLGYRGRYEYFGKPAARLDDVLNVIPARFTALLLAAAAPVVGGSPLQVIRVSRRERRRTASPNAGWSMAAAAVALNRCLEKRGHYRINPAAPTAGPADIARARRLAIAALAVGGTLTLTSQAPFGRLRARDPLRDA